MGGQKEIEKDSYIGVLGPRWCASGRAKRNRGIFTYWCAGALMVCWLVGKKVLKMIKRKWCAGALMVCWLAGKRVWELLHRWCAGVLLNRNGRSVL